MTEGAQAATRVLDLLDRLGQAPEGARVSDLADESGLPLPTVHRLLQSLVATGFAAQDPSTKAYHVGPSVQRLVLGTGPGLGLEHRARPYLEELRDSVGETVFLSVVDRNELVYLACLMPDTTVRMVGEPGMRVPLHATSQGKAVLAFLSEGERSAIIEGLDLAAFTDHTVTTPEDLERDLDRVRLVGYAVNDEERELGVRSVAAPVLDDFGRPVAAVCIGAPAFRTPTGRLEGELATAVAEAAARIGAACVQTSHVEEVST